MQELKKDLDERILSAVLKVDSEKEHDLTKNELLAQQTPEDRAKVRASCWWESLKRQIDACPGTSLEETEIIVEKIKESIEEGKLNLSERDFKKALEKVKTLRPGPTYLP